MDANNGTPVNSFDENMRAVAQSLPAPIRNYLASGKYSDIARAVMGTYQLHVDQAGIFERELILLIMGLETPAEFEDALMGEASIPESTVQSIINDVNQEVFVPLRNEMEKGAAPAPTPSKPKPAPPAPPRVSIPSQAPAAPATPPPPMPRAPITDPERELPVGESASVAAPGPASAPLPPKALQPRSGAAGLPASIPAMNAPRPTPPPLRQQFAPPPPPNLPGAMPAARGPMPPKPTTPPPAKPYEADPYREPLE